MHFKKKILKNGLRIVAVPIKDSPSVTVMSMVEAGSEYEDKSVNGISHFLEHMCFKGTSNRPKSIDISKEFDSMGAQNNAFTTYEFTGYWGKAHSKHTDKILDIIADMYLNPTLPEAELEKEKGVITEEINMYEDLPKMHVEEVFDSLLYGDQPAGRSVLGPKENIKRMKRNDFVDYRKTHYVASKTVIVVAGRIDPGAIFKKVEKAFKTANRGKVVRKKRVVEKQSNPAIKIEHKDTDQAHLIIGVRTFDLFDKRMPALKVLSTILGTGMSSRLFQKMREELGICYYTKSEIKEFTDHGSLMISAGVDKTRINIGVSSILEEIKRIRDEKVPEHELQKAKDCMIGNMYLGLESSDALAGFFGVQEILREKIKTPAEIEKEIRKVTSNDVQNLAKQIMRNDRLNLAIVGKPENDVQLKKILKV